MKKLKKSDNELLEEINEKLTVLIAIFFLQGKEIDVQIKILKDHGLTWDEIGKLVGLTAGAARKRFERN